MSASIWSTVTDKELYNPSLFSSFEVVNCAINYCGTRDTIFPQECKEIANICLFPEHLRE